MFYNTFEQLCKERGIKPGRAASEMGISRAAVTRWKNEGFTPRGEALEKIAAYFGVSIDFLLHGKPTATQNEMEEFLEMLKNRQECRMLFSLAKNANRADVERAVKIIEALREVPEE